jgi:hypothetical protein
LKKLCIHTKPELRKINFLIFITLIFECLINISLFNIFICKGAKAKYDFFKFKLKLLQFGKVKIIIPLFFNFFLYFKISFTGSDVCSKTPNKEITSNFFFELFCIILIFFSELDFNNFNINEFLKVKVLQNLLKCNKKNKLPGEISRYSLSFDKYFFNIKYSEI